MQFPHDNPPQVATICVMSMITYAPPQVATICVMPMITYVLLPIVIRFGSRNLHNFLGGRQRLYDTMDFCHDWSMGDVWLLAFIVGWLSFNASDETAAEILPVGSYFTLV